MRIIAKQWFRNKANNMHLPRKRFGQHFLSDQSVVQHIVSVLAPEPNQHLVEIGPGQGALTVPVIKLCQQLEVVELDRDLIPEITSRAPRGTDLIVHEADALKFDFGSLKQDARMLRVFGNLPYNISTPLIFHLLSFSDIVSDMVFMLQREVALRLAANPGSHDYGRLSVMTQYQCRVELLFDVPPEAFYPPPKVQSSIVRLIPHHPYPHIAKQFSQFENIVKLAFGQRRKALRNSLKQVISDEVWEKTGIEKGLRAENLSVADFVALSNALDS